MAETRYVGWSSSNSTYVCDGTDDHVQINQALAWAALNPGSTIYMRGPYTYNIKEQLKTGSYTKWTGDATAVLKIPNNACGTSISTCKFPDGTPVITQITGTIPKELEISGFAIDGNCQNQSTVLGYAGSKLSSAGSGVQRLIGFKGSASGSKVEDIYIHDLTAYDSFGEAVHIAYGKNIRVSNNSFTNHQHDAVFLIEVTGEGNKVNNNTIQGITDGCIRLDNCQNFDVYDNALSSYLGDHNNGAVEHGENGIQIANEKNKTTLTDNIHVYNNTFSGHGLAGIWINDQLKKAGATAQTVKIDHNTFTGCGWASWANWCSGISVWWGNGVTIEKNTFNGCYQEGIQILSAISSSATHTVTVKNNNIINTVGKRSGSTGSSITIVGYGIYNAVPTKTTVKAQGNYLSGNLKGDYSGVSPSSTASAYITDAVPYEGTGINEDDTDDSSDSGGSDVSSNDGVYIPSTVSIIDDEYYVDRDENDVGAYINKFPFGLQSFKGIGGKTVGETKSPSVAGSNLSDFDFEGSNVTLDCVADSPEEVYEVLANFYHRGHTTIELGTPHLGYKITGMGVTHEGGFDKTAGDVPEEIYPYKLNFKVEKPYMEKIKKRARGRYIHESCQFSSDDLYAGNLVKNPSFEDWTPNTNIAWTLEDSISDNIWKCIRYSNPLAQYCAVASSGVDTRIMIKNYGESWRLPTNLLTENRNNDFTTGVWCDDWGIWAVFSDNGLPGYACVTSPNGDDWTARATPIESDLQVTTTGDYIVTTDSDIIASNGGGGINAWQCSLYIPISSGLTTTGRVLVFASAGTQRVMYSDDQCTTWTLVTSADETASWISTDFAPELGRIVKVASSGQVAYSDDLGATWSLVTAPSQKWTSVRWASAFECWVACSEDGTQQIMTSPTGLSDTWTLMDTPYASSTTKSVSGVVVTTLADHSPTDHIYTTKYSTYSLECTFVLPALTNTHVYRLNNVNCYLYTQNSTSKAYCKVTVQVPSLYSGVETTLKEWTETSTSPKYKSLNLALETVTNETVTLRFYIKGTKTAYKASAKLFGYSISEKTRSGSSITYTRNALTDLVVANEVQLIMAIANTGTGNRCMYTTDLTEWKIGNTAGDYGWDSICYAEGPSTIAAVSSSISGGHVMILDGYGVMKNIAPNSWTLTTTGQSRSDEYITDGSHSMLVEGDGVTPDPGHIYQIMPFDSVYDTNEMYLLSIRAMISGLTSGSFKADLYAGGTVIKEIAWTENTTEPTRKQIKFKFEVVPKVVYLRVHGSGTPNIGSKCYFDDAIVEKMTDFDIAETGSEIYTSGKYPVIPDVTLKGVSPDTASPTTSRIISDTTDLDDVFQSSSKSHGTAVNTVVLPALAGGSTYKIKSVSGKLSSSNAAAYSYVYVTVQAASLYSGKEHGIALWTTNSTDWVTKNLTIPYTIESASNETVTLRYYIHTSNTSYPIFAKELGYVVYEIVEITSAIGNAIFLYNTADSTKVLKCCNTLPQGYIQQIKSNYTGSHRYVESFEDGAYSTNAYSRSGSIARNSSKNSLYMAAGSYIVFPFDTLFPVTAIPFIQMYVYSGIPQISIADASGTDGAPGTFYLVDGNTTDTVTNTVITRSLTNASNLVLRGSTKYYVKIAPGASTSCEFGQMLEYASLDTMDAQRFFIYSTGLANTFAAVVNGTGKCSAVVQLGYHDADIIP